MLKKGILAIATLNLICWYVIVLIYFTTLEFFDGINLFKNHPEQILYKLTNLIVKQWFMLGFSDCPKAVRKEIPWFTSFFRWQICAPIYREQI